MIEDMEIARICTNQLNIILNNSSMDFSSAAKYLALLMLTSL